MIVFLFASFLTVFNHITVGDHDSACREGEVLVRTCPESFQNWEAYLVALAAAGKEEAMCAVFNKMAHQFGEKAYNHKIIESMAWSILREGSKSYSPFIRTYACLGAFFGQDAEGIKILQALLEDANCQVRRAAAELSGHLKDWNLTAGLRKMALNDSDWKARLTAIQSLGSMQDYVFLFSMLDRSLTSEEREAVVMALCEKATSDQIEHLGNSPYAQARAHSAVLIGRERIAGKQDLLSSLAKDPSPQVRRAAIKALSLTGCSDLQQFLSYSQDIDPSVQIQAAHAVAQLAPNRAKPFFDKLLSHPRAVTRAEAAAALAATADIALIRHAFSLSDDPFVRINLAMGLAAQRVDLQDACRAISSMPPSLLMWSKTSEYRAVVPSDLVHDPATANLPQAQDQVVRLELWALLAVLQDPGAEEKIASYLENSRWGMTAMAASVLLTEGSRFPDEAVRALLDHASAKVRVQAALILALWSGDEAALDILVREYPNAGREMKERILEGLGKIASPASIPFLTEQLSAQRQSLRIIAAAVLLQTLYA